MSRLHRHLMRVLIGEIVGGSLPPGSALPRELDVATQFGVSRGVARECVRGLEERGLVSVKHGRGTTVNDDDSWNVFDPDVLAALIEADDGAAVLAEYLECRRVLEIEAAGLAAQRATDEDLAALADALARMTASALQTAHSPAAEDLYHDADIAFHRALIAATGNRALGNMTEPVHRALAAARGALTRPEQRLAQSLPEHQRILAAIAARDADAARAAMQAHLLTIEGYLKQYAADAAAHVTEGGEIG